ncbi:MAG TPA: 3-hydroxyacyl-CoA dehydrogenase NAD-binding domain-containing protein [Stellaceae bacterium]|nr:3-hydroxyacyl-CoA dehydrogenase NAD-binding domain-containing protein [Stellaceae bacterium]
MSDTATRKVATIGAGTIGASWAAVFLAHGLTVAASDPGPGAEDFLKRFVAAAWPSLARLVPLPAVPPWQRLSFHAEPEAALEGAAFVQESAPEREDLKRALVARLDAALDPSVVIASSSSGLLMSRIQDDCRHPERCVLGHPFNPPHLVPLVEVVGGDKTAPWAIEQALAFYKSVGKAPIHIRREVRGHVANRLQAALWREALHLVAEGVASVADVDTAISAGPGLRWALMGPHLTFHLAGGTGGIAHFFDQFAGPMTEWWNELGRPVLTPELRQRLAAGIAEEAAGRDVAQLEARRDRFLVDLLAMKAGVDP